ncbi:hypothetical protein B0H34DRAFT_713107 [Crassisporium funariophilum]|nr:hypothetical protein B0H34DRAFT_713107 [Crassisporium funariophilum]
MGEGASLLSVDARLLSFFLLCGARILGLLCRVGSTFVVVVVVVNNNRAILSVARVHDPKHCHHQYLGCDDVMGRSSFRQFPSESLV